MCIPELSNMFQGDTKQAWMPSVILGANVAAVESSPYGEACLCH